jgi:hypothetical protein
MRERRSTNTNCKRHFTAVITIGRYFRSNYRSISESEIHDAAILINAVGLWYYHVLWVSKYQRVSKCSLLRDRHNKLADPFLDISPIYYLIIDHQRNKEVLLCLLHDLADIARKDSKVIKTVPGLSISPHNTVRFSRYYLCMSYKVCVNL